MTTDFKQIDTIKSYILEWGTGGNWTEGPSMLNQHAAAACGHVDTGEGPIAVIIGDQQTGEGTVEVYWHSNNSFTAGPELPRKVNEAAIVQTGGEIFLVGGVSCCPEESADILRFDF